MCDSQGCMLMANRSACQLMLLPLHIPLNFLYWTLLKISSYCATWTHLVKDYAEGSQWMCKCSKVENFFTLSKHLRLFSALTISNVCWIFIIMLYWLCFVFLRFILEYLDMFACRKKAAREGFLQRQREGLLWGRFSGESPALPWLLTSFFASPNHCFMMASHQEFRGRMCGAVLQLSLQTKPSEMLFFYLIYKIYHANSSLFRCKRSYFICIEDLVKRLPLKVSIC